MVCDKYVALISPYILPTTTRNQSCITDKLLSSPCKLEFKVSKITNLGCTLSNSFRSVCHFGLASGKPERVYCTKGKLSPAL